MLPRTIEVTRDCLLVHLPFLFELGLLLPQSSLPFHLRQPPQLLFLALPDRLLLRAPRFLSLAVGLFLCLQNLLFADSNFLVQRIEHVRARDGPQRLGMSSFRAE